MKYYDMIEMDWQLNLRWGVRSIFLVSPAKRKHRDKRQQGLKYVYNIQYTIPTVYHVQIYHLPQMGNQKESTFVKHKIEFLWPLNKTFIQEDCCAISTMQVVHIRCACWQLNKSKMRALSQTQSVTIRKEMLNRLK